MTAILLSLLASIGIFAHAIDSKKEPKNIMMIASGEYVIGSDTTAFSDILNHEWFGLEENEDGQFSFVQTDVNIETFLNDCLMDTITEIYFSQKLAFSGSSISERIIDCVPIVGGLDIPIDSNYSFAFNGIKYTFRAEGRTEGEAPDSDPSTWDHIKDYKLYLSNGKTEQLVITQESFHDTRMQILFVGDMDQDGLLDIIASDPADYETFSFKLFLSSHREDGDLVGLADVGGYDFSC